MPVSNLSRWIAYGLAAGTVSIAAVAQAISAIDEGRFAHVIVELVPPP